MLYTIFLYQSESGLLLFDKSFQDISSGKMELFSSFFSALKAFIGEMIIEGSTELKNISLGDYTVLIESRRHYVRAAFVKGLGFAGCREVGGWKGRKNGTKRQRLSEDKEANQNYEG